MNCLRFRDADVVDGTVVSRKEDPTVGKLVKDFSAKWNTCRSFSDILWSEDGRGASRASRCEGEEQGRMTVMREVAFDGGLMACRAASHKCPTPPSKT